jgi:hypothetical protein
VRRFALATLALSAALGSASVLAQTPAPRPDAPVVEEAPTVVTLKKTALDFTEVRVVGDLERPGGDVVWSRPPVKFRNLIELRGNFRPELARSASKLP